MICPECKGKGKILGLFPVWAKNVAQEDRKPYIEMDCYRCCSSGEVPKEMLEWIKAGNTLREKRRSKRITLRAASKVTGIDASILCNMENGCIKPDPAIEY